MFSLVVHTYAQCYDTPYAGRAWSRNGRAGDSSCLCRGLLFCFHTWRMVCGDDAKYGKKLFPMDHVSQEFTAQQALKPNHTIAVIFFLASKSHFVYLFRGANFRLRNTCLGCFLWVHGCTWYSPSLPLPGHESCNPYPNLYRLEGSSY